MTALRRPDSVLLALFLTICTFGIIVLSSASSVESFQSLGDPNAMLKKQIIALLIGLLLMVLVMRLNLDKLRKWYLPLLVGSIFLSILPFIPHIGTQLLGAKRWILIGGFFFQPSELVKLALVLFLSTWLIQKQQQFEEPKKALIPLLALLGTICVILIMQPDLGTAIVILGIGMVLYFAAGAPFKHFLWIAMLFVAGLVLIIQIAPYRAARLTVFLNPGKDTQGTAYHINQSLLAIGSGGIFGRGLGHSIQKFNYLPESAGDSIFAIAAEELGFILSLCIIALYVGILWRGVTLARRASDPSTRLLMIGIVSWFTIQAFVNIGALTSLLPLTGEPLPFISNGGSSLVISLVGVGILLNASKTVRV